MTTNQPLTAILIGAGARGRGVYGKWIREHPGLVKLAAVAEPDQARRDGCASEHSIPGSGRFQRWEDLLEKKIPADLCIIATQDRMHTEPALKALDLGYDVLLEKPMATTAEACRDLVQKSEITGKDLRICHVARYAEFWQRTKKAVTDGLLGDIIHINHAENVAHWHFAHAYVRGSWRRADESSPVVLAKTCHDLDLLYWLVEDRVLRVHSFGNLAFFNEAHAPAGAPARCTDGCPAAGSCLFYAPRMYITAEVLLRMTARSSNAAIRLLGKTAIERPGMIRALSKIVPPLKGLVDWQMWPTNVITDHGTLEEKWDAMRHGPYGRCVFRCDNDVPDHQAVSLDFVGGVSATMTVQGHSYLDGRWIRIDGTKGTLAGRWTWAGEKLVWYDHRTLKKTLLWKSGIGVKMHGGGDERLMESFVRDLLNRRAGIARAESLTDARASLESHLMAFAAETSRLEGRVVSMEEFR